MTHTEALTSPSPDLFPDLFFLRFPDLVERRIVNNRVTVNRWIKAGTFPKPIELAPNSLAWRLTDIQQWIKQRAEAGRSVRNTPPALKRVRARRRKR